MQLKLDRRTYLQPGTDNLNRRVASRHRYSSVAACGKRPMQPVAAANTAQHSRITLEAQLATADNFKPFGQLISATDDGKKFDGEDAQLVLDRGTPRFYIMRLPRRGLTFDRITYHADVTQCLGSLTPEPWYLTVAQPSGSVQRPPDVQDLHAFRIPHGAFVKLKMGTWHAGPLFDNADSMSFYNLELADTNVVDHNTHRYDLENRSFEVREQPPGLN